MGNQKVEIVEHKQVIAKVGSAVLSYFCGGEFLRKTTTDGKHNCIKCGKSIIWDEEFCLTHWAVKEGSNWILVHR